MCMIVRRLPSLERVVTGSFARRPPFTFATLHSSTYFQRSAGVMFQLGTSPRSTRWSCSNLLWAAICRASNCSSRDSTVCSSLMRPARSAAAWVASFSRSAFALGTVALRPCASPARKPLRSDFSTSARSSSKACSSAAFFISSSISWCMLSFRILSSFCLTAFWDFISSSRSCSSHSWFWGGWLTGCVMRVTCAKFFSGTCLKSSMPSRSTTQRPL
mmetsp:Transcript_101071/g.261213  ORF Transcript_101071/g.261213 Transcript_101071/m.261213 type:complete len:217 (-) Transcript_101071:254-904(-)